MVDVDFSPQTDTSERRLRGEIIRYAEPMVTGEAAA
jgi:hypothetical protein